MTTRRILFIALIALPLGTSCGLSPVPDLPSLGGEDDGPGFGTGGGSAATGGSDAGPSHPAGGSGGDEANNNTGGRDDRTLMGGMGGDR